MLGGGTFSNASYSNVFKNIGLDIKRPIVSGLGRFKDALKAPFANTNFATQMDLARQFADDPSSKRHYQIQALIDSKFDLQKLHFHQVSRIFEIRILVLGKGNSGKLVSDNVIFEALELLPFYIFYEQCWILARIIKALSFTKKLNNALKNPEFSNAISLTYFKMEGKVQSIAELIIQLTYHALLRKNENQIFAPNRIQEKHLNETNARIAIESATALLYAEPPVKNILENNLISFAEKSGNGWVWEMLK
jgi:hypothetical protein